MVREMQKTAALCLLAKALPGSVLPSIQATHNSCSCLPTTVILTPNTPRQRH